MVGTTTPSKENWRARIASFAEVKVQACHSHYAQLWQWPASSSYMYLCFYVARKASEIQCFLIINRLLIKYPLPPLASAKIRQITGPGCWVPAVLLLGTAALILIYDCICSSPLPFQRLTYCLYWLLCITSSWYSHILGLNESQTPDRPLQSTHAMTSKLLPSCFTQHC